MEALKRQASKFREQVSRQQQALLRQLGHLGAEDISADEAQIAQHDHLHNLYRSTRAAKHFEKDLIHGIEGLTSVTSKEIEIERRFARDCCRYEAENHCSTSSLAEVASRVGESRNLMIKEKETLFGVFDEQVCKPLRAMVRSAELEDARLLIRRYDKLWQDVEAQAAEVYRLKSKASEGAKSGDNSIKLQIAEERLDELKSRLMALGKEATSAMESVEAQQQRLTFQQLVIMVNAERSFHHSVLTILENLVTEMVRVEQSSMFSPGEGHVAFGGNKEHRPSNADNQIFVAKPWIKTSADETSPSFDVLKQHAAKIVNRRFSKKIVNRRYLERETTDFRTLEVVHPFDAQTEGELSLAVDDTVYVHQVIPGGWCKGECNGKTGWFPSPYVEKISDDAASKVANGKI